MAIAFEKSNRGFDVAEFLDRYGSKCRLQKSSLATEDCIWFGVDTPFPSWTGTGNVSMHLTQQQVRELLPFLTRFALTGELK